MALKLDDLSPRELAALIEQARAQMSTARSAQIADVRTKIDALLDKEGLTIGDVYPGGSKSSQKMTAKRAGAGVPKFRNPNDPGQTWTGFGKKPAWFIAALKTPGVTADSLRVGAGKAAVVKKAAAAKKPKKAAAKKPARGRNS